MHLLNGFKPVTRLLCVGSEGTRKGAEGKAPPTGARGQGGEEVLGGRGRRGATKATPRHLCCKETAATAAALERLQQP